MGSNIRSIFISTNNTVYVTDQTQARVIIWNDGNSIPIRNLSGNLSQPSGLFVTVTNQIYVDSDNATGIITQWMMNSPIGIPVMYTCSKCYQIFVDTDNNLYCSMWLTHQIIRKSLNTASNALVIVAGTGIAGNTPTRLNSPYGIFVDLNSDLYVADYANNRIQLFQFQQLSGTTVAGSGSANVTIQLNHPTAVVLDADNYLYISDTFNHRIVSSGPNGFRCIAGCSRLAGVASDQFNLPSALSFDNYGNVFVIDYNNQRIQKFTLLTGLCSKHIKLPNILESFLLL